MKKTKFFTLVLCGLLLVSCGNNKKDSDAKSDDDSSLTDFVDAAKTMKDAAETMDDASKRSEDLAKMKTVSNDVLKKVFPKTLVGLKRSKYRVGGSAMFGKMQSGNATYKKDNNHHIELSIVDGAGKTGSAIYSLAQLKLGVDMEEQTDHGFKKTTEIDGHKAFVELDSTYSKNIETSITFNLYHRFMITLKGENIPLKKLRQAYQELDFTPLKDASEE